MPAAAPANVPAAGPAASPRRFRSPGTAATTSPRSPRSPGTSPQPPGSSLRQSPRQPHVREDQANRAWSSMLAPNPSQHLESKTRPSREAKNDSLRTNPTLACSTIASPPHCRCRRAWGGSLKFFSIPIRRGDRYRRRLWSAPCSMRRIIGRRMNGRRAPTACATRAGCTMRPRAGFCAPKISLPLLSCGAPVYRQRRMTNFAGRSGWGLWTSDGTSGSSSESAR
jgi:hypothetical protein